MARALQRTIDLPFWHISIDHLRDSGVLPFDRFQTGEFDWQPARRAFFDGFHTSLAAYADAGNNLIIEHIMDTSGWAETLHALLRPHDVLFVGIHCAIPELQRREARRGDRPTGSAKRDQRTIHQGRVYDLEVNSEDGVQTNVALILTAWRSGLRASEFR